MIFIGNCLASSQFADDFAAVLVLIQKGHRQDGKPQ